MHTENGEETQQDHCQSREGVLKTPDEILSVVDFSFDEFAIS